MTCVWNQPSQSSSSSYQDGEERSLRLRRHISNGFSSFGRNNLGEACHLWDHQQCFQIVQMVTFPKKPVRGFSLKGELGADVFALLRRPLLKWQSWKNIILFLMFMILAMLSMVLLVKLMPMKLMKEWLTKVVGSYPLPVIEVDEAEEGILALVVPTVVDVPLSKQDVYVFM